jgi:vacuolar-type H+-ATPase subunit D/Vma8
MSKQLRERLAEVARLRKETEALRAKVTEAKALVTATSEHIAMGIAFDVYTASSEELDKAETLAKQEALAEYEVTQDKRPMAGVEIKVFKTVEYDEQAATVWCRMSAPTMLKLDVKRFEKAVKDGVFAAEVSRIAQVIDEPRAQLGGDLSEYEVEA